MKKPYAGHINRVPCLQKRESQRLFSAAILTLSIKKYKRNTRYISTEKHIKRKLSHKNLSIEKKVVFLHPISRAKSPQRNAAFV